MGAPVLDGPIGVGLDAAKREEMHLFDTKIRMCGLVTCKRLDDVYRFIGQQQFRDIHRALLQHLERWSDTAGNGEFDQGLQFGGPGNADVHGQGDAGGIDRIYPFDDRTCFKGKLGGTDAQMALATQFPIR